MNALRQALINADAKAACEAWKTVAPHLPQPADSDEAEATMHMARAMAASTPATQRRYSEGWLADNGYPAPDRFPPRKVDAVGVAVRSAVPEVRAAITGAMSDAVADCYANGDRDPLIVKPQMMAARARERRGLMLPAIGVS